MAKDLPETDIGNSLRDIANESSLNKAERVSLRAIAKEYDKLCKAYEGLVDVLIGDGPFPIIPCLAILADAADHLLKDHNCDSHNYEQVGNVAIVARQRIGEIKQALSEKVEE